MRKITVAKKKTLFYSSFEDDFEQTQNQNFKLPDDYKWIKKDPLSKFLGVFTYALAIVFSSVYCHLFLGVRIKGKKLLKNSKKTGAFIYGNHTQPIGDVFNPALACFPYSRIYTVVSPANYALPIIGKILPYLGALPIPDTVTGMKKFTEALNERLDDGHPIVIYPEAHIWPYYTKIRPFPDTSFKFPVKAKKPSFAMTATYQKRRWRKRPKITIYIDGPFFADETLSRKEQPRKLAEDVFKCMSRRAELSNCEYITYKHRDGV